MMMQKHGRSKFNMEIVKVKRKKGEMFSFWSIRKDGIIFATANTLEEAISICNNYPKSVIEIRQRWY